LRQVAIVTGSGRGIGAATVAHLAGEGWRVVAVDRGAVDPRLPYAMATGADLAAMVDATIDGVGVERVRGERADATDLAAMAAVVERAEEWARSRRSSPTPG
jgi:NAD(P)-dependent dehydrogenase (short-subunit alcohol dehydrogenase family)